MYVFTRSQDTIYFLLWVVVKKKSWKVTAFANTVYKSAFLKGYLYQLKMLPSSHRAIKWGCVGLSVHAMCWIRGAFFRINQGNEVNLAWFVLCKPVLIPNYACLKTISWFFCLIRCSQTQQRIELKHFMSVFFHTPYFDRFENCPSLVFLLLCFSFIVLWWGGISPQSALLLGAPYSCFKPSS